MRAKLHQADATAVVGTGESKPAPLDRLLSGFHALTIRNFRLFIFGQVISLTGTWMQTTAEAWLVLRLSNSPFALGFVTTLQFLPVMLLTLYGGVLADRLPKRKTLIITQALMLVQATIFGLLVGTNTIQLWHIYILAIMQGILSAIDTPVRLAFVSEMVGEQHLVNAVAVNSMTFNGGRIIGPAVAGLVIAKIGIAPALYINAVSFIAVLWALFLMRERELFITEKPARTDSDWQRLKDGLAYSWRTPKVLVILIMLAAIGTFGFNLIVTLPLIAEFVLRTDAQGFGLFSSFFGAGALIGALSSAYLKDIRLRRLFLTSGVFSVVFALLAVTQVFAISALLLMVLGATAISFGTSSNSLLQLSVPDELRGRVMSIHVLLILGSTPIGAFLVGTISEHFGVTPALLTCAFLCLMGVISAAVYQYHHRAADLMPEPTVSTADH